MQQLLQGWSARCGSVDGWLQSDNEASMLLCVLACSEFHTRSNRLLAGSSTGRAMRN